MLDRLRIEGRHLTPTHGRATTVTYRRLVAASTHDALAALASGAEALIAMWSDSARTCSGSGSDDGPGEVNLDSRVSERLAARRSADQEQVRGARPDDFLSGVRFVGW